MKPKDLVQALLEAPDRDARQALLPPRDGPFYISVLELLKDEVDHQRLRDPPAALQISGIADEVADWLASQGTLAGREIDRCRGLAAWGRGNVLIHQGAYDDCLAAYRTAAGLLAAGGAEIETARLVANQAWALKSLGRYDEALEAVQTALDTLERHPPSIFRASSHNLQGVLAWFLGRYDDALAAYDKAARIYGDLGEGVRLARVLVNRASLLETLDRFDEALALYGQARAVLVDMGVHLEVARVDLNLGILHTRLGRYDEALAALDGAETGFRRLEVEMEAAVVGLYRADLYAEANLLDELLQTSTRGWHLFAERGMQRQAARAALHQASAWRKLSQLARAGDLLDQARAILTLLDDPLWVLQARLEQVAQWAALGQNEPALRLAVQTAGELRRRGLPLRGAGASLLAGQVALEMGRLQEAAAHFQEVLEQDLNQEAPSLLYRARHGLGCVARALGDLEAAAGHYRTAVDVVEAHRQRLRVEDHRLGFVEDKLAVYRDAALACLALGREEEAWGYVERSKSGALADLMLANAGRRARAGTGTEGALLDRLAALGKELNWHCGRLDLASPGDRDDVEPPPSPMQERNTLQRISDIEEQAASAWRELQQAAPFYARLDPGALSVPTALEESLRPGELLLHYFAAGDSFHALVAGPKGLLTSQSLSASPARVRNAMDALATTLRGAANLDPSYVANTLAPLSRQQLAWLYDDLLRPLLPHLAGARRLLIAPDGDLHQVPFHALFDGREHLLDRFEVVYAPSLGVLRLCRENLARSAPPTRGPLLAGYADDEALPHLRREIETLARVLPGAETLLGKEATLARLQAGAAGRSLLHLATHAIFRDDNPHFSAIQLAGGDWLRAIDLYQVKLEGALVALSSCRSGGHRLLGGDLLGLSRGFYAAGASALVLSLWPVDDGATARLMEGFYTRLAAGQMAATALRGSQLDLRDFKEERAGGQQRPYAHPFFWAPFCLVGAPEAGLASPASGVASVETDA